MDLNDLEKAGYDIDALIQAARTSDPVAGSDWPRLAGEGLKFLVALFEALGTAQDAKSATDLITSFMSDKSRRYAAGAALATRPADTSAVLTGSRGLPRAWWPAMRDLRTTIEEEAEVVKRALEQREDKYHAQVIGAVLRPVLPDGVKLSCPAGYELDPDGVSGDDGVICQAPIAIIGQAVDYDDRSVWLELAWRRGNAWQTKLVDRAHVMESRSLAKLAHDGAPVGSHNAGALVKYFAAFEAQNITRLPQRTVTRRMGWHGDAFVIGKSGVGGDVRLVEDRGYGEPFGTSGTWEGWCAAVRDLLADKPMVMLALYAAVAAPLLACVGAPGFAVDFSGETSQGKTTALQVAASVSGRPGSQAFPNGVMRSWRSASSVGTMWLAWFHQSLPLILDDTKRGKPAVVEQALYDIPAGKDSIRGDETGAARQERTWKTVLISSGEAPITSFSKAGGAQARVLTLSGSPLGTMSAEDGRALATEIEHQLHEHYGHLMPMVVDFLLKHKAQWPKMREEHQALVKEIAAKMGTAVGGRLAGYVASVALAARLCVKLGVPGDPKPSIDLLIGSAVKSSVDGDMPREAMDALYTWAAMNESSFLTRFSTEHGQQVGAQPSGGWLGKWSPGDTWSQIGFDRAKVVRKLEEWGYPPSDILAAWKRRGWLETDEQGNDLAWAQGGAKLMVVKRRALRPV